MSSGGISGGGGGWRIEMLGGLRAVRGDRTLERFPSRKTASLLAYLALHPGRFHARDALSEMLWPDAPRASQLHNLRLTLALLRKLLAPDDALVDADRLAVRLDPAGFTTDVAEFEDAVARKDGDAARARYRGPLLPGLSDDWVPLPQARLEALREQLDESGECAAAAVTRLDPHRLPRTLPLPLTRFFGRDRELAALGTLLDDSRLVTLTGAGGTGKTRLAIEAARAQAAAAQDRRADAFVSLADLTDPAQVPEAVRGALRLPAPAPGFSVTDLVRRELAAFGPLLLVLDNAEQLLKGRHLADFVLGSLAEVPGLTVLVASRRALEIPGEVVFPVGPLPMEARVALFLDRARAARPGFRETPQTLAAVRDLCRRLEGLPLALELAAARAGVLSVQEILDNVARRLDFLAARADSGATRRHRSLRAAIRSGFDLLAPELQEQFARLSVFRGGFTAGAAAAVAGARLDALDELLRWSILHAEEQGDGSLRFRMGETLRDFGQECLAEPDVKTLSREHARFFCAWAEANRADDAHGPGVPDPATRRARQDAEQDNVRAALTFCRKSRRAEDRETGLRLVAAFWTFWFVRNAGQEMEEWATALLDPATTNPAEPVPPLVRARAQLALGLAVRERGETARFAALVEEARAVLEEGPPDRHLAFARHLDGLAWADRHGFAEAAAAYADAESLWEALGDRRNGAVTRHNRALLALEEGDLDRAERLVGEALAVFRPADEVSWTAMALLTQAGVRAGRGDFAGASAACAESTALYGPLGYARGEAQARQGGCRYLAAQCLWDEAAEEGQHALLLFRKVGDRHGEATALLSLADVAVRRSADAADAVAAADYRARAREYVAEAARLQERNRWPSVAPLLAQAEASLAG